MKSLEAKDNLNEEELSILSIPSNYENLKEELEIMGYSDSFDESSTPLIQKLLKDLLFCHERLEKTVKSTKKSKVSEDYFKSQAQILATENNTLLTENSKLNNKLQQVIEKSSTDQSIIAMEKLKKELDFERHKTTMLEARFNQMSNKSNSEESRMPIDTSNIFKVPDNVFELQNKLDVLLDSNNQLQKEKEKLLSIIQTRFSAFKKGIEDSLLLSHDEISVHEIMNEFSSTIELIRSPLEPISNSSSEKFEKKAISSQTEVKNTNYDELKVQNEEFSNKISSLTFKIEAMNEKFQKLMLPTESNQTSIMQVHTLEKERMELVLSNETLMKRNKELSKNLDEMELQVENLRDMVVNEGNIQLKESILMLENEVEQKNIFLRQSRRLNESLKEEVFLLKEKMSLLEIEKLKFNEKKTVSFKDDSVEMIRLKSKLQKSNQVNKELKNKLGIIINKYKIIENFFTLLKTEKTKLLSMCKDNSEQASLLHSENEKFKFQIKKLVTKLKKQEITLKDNRGMLHNFEKTSKKLLVDNRSKARQIKKLEEELDQRKNLSKAMQKQDITLKDLISRENKNNMERINLDIELEKVKNRLKISENENSILNGLLNQEKEKIKKLEKAVSKLRDKRAQKLVEKATKKQLNSMATGESSASEILSRHKGLGLSDNNDSLLFGNTDQLEKQCRELEEMISEQSQILKDLEG